MDFYQMSRAKELLERNPDRNPEYERLLREVWDYNISWRRLEESQFSRIYMAIRSGTPFCHITAWRNQSANHPTDKTRKEFNVKQNRERNIQLVSQLRSLGLRAIKINGFFKEEGAALSSNEESFFVTYDGDNIDWFKRRMLALASQFNQDSVIFSDGNSVELVKPSGSVEMSFSASKFSMKDFEVAWSRVRGHRFAYFESAIAPSSVNGQWAYHESGLESDLRGVK